jgi:hypothetical protein
MPVGAPGRRPYGRSGTGTGNGTGNGVGNGVGNGTGVGVGTGVGNGVGNGTGVANGVGVGVGTGVGEALPRGPARPQEFRPALRAETATAGAGSSTGSRLSGGSHSRMIMEGGPQGGDVDRGAGQRRNVLR